MQWLAVYKDDTTLSQYNEDGTENRYFDIDRNRLTHFAILDEDKAVLVIEFERPTQQLIFRRRHHINLAGNHAEIYLVGWHENIHGTNIKVINYIYPDGKIVLAGAKDDVELLEGEI
jgi:hypothetical protein